MSPKDAGPRMIMADSTTMRLTPEVILNVYTDRVELMADCGEECGHPASIRLSREGWTTLKRVLCGELEDNLISVCEDVYIRPGPFFAQLACMETGSYFSLHPELWSALEEAIPYVDAKLCPAPVSEVPQLSKSQHHFVRAFIQLTPDVLLNIYDERIELIEVCCSDPSPRVMCLSQEGWHTLKRVLRGEWDIIYVCDGVYIRRGSFFPQLACLNGPQFSLHPKL